MIRPANKLSSTQREALQSVFLVDPPPMLRERILNRSRPSGSVRHAPLAAALFALALVLWPTLRPQPTSAPGVVAIDWRARSAQLERVWQQIGDRDWLQHDVRAVPISRRLRLLDERLSAQVGNASTSTDVNDLWRERSETLAELVSLRQQGGYAIRL